MQDVSATITLLPSTTEGHLLDSDPSDSDQSDAVDAYPTSPTSVQSSSSSSDDDLIQDDLIRVDENLDAPSSSVSVD